MCGSTSSENSSGPGRSRGRPSSVNSPVDRGRLGVASQDLTPEQVVARRDLHRQVYWLRTDYLPRMDYENILAQDGYEADDIFSTLMGDDVEARKGFIQKNAKDVRFLDI